MAKPIPSERDRLAAEELAKNPLAPKGHATPTRKEREAARRRPLIGGATPEARRASRAESTAQARSQRERARIGMANGEEQYLMARDRGPQKRFARAWIDARWSLGELLVPVVVVMLITTFLPPAIQLPITFGIYGFIVLLAVDSVFVGYRLKKKIVAKFGADKAEPVVWYTVRRIIQLRVLRMPRPQQKRGDFPS